MDLKDTYNKIAKDWHQDHLNDSWWFGGVDKFVSFLKNGDAILDVGCGAGHMSKYLIDKGMKVTGIDFSEELIKIAQQDVPAGDFFVMDLNDVSELNQTFDGILLQAVLLHIPKKEVVEKVKNILKLLKPGGYVYIAVKETKPDQEDEKIEVENDYGYDYERFFSYFTMDEMKNILKEVDLELVYESVVPTHSNKRWLQVIGRKI